MKKAILESIYGALIECYATTDTPSSSYGQAMWVGVDDNEPYMQVDLPEYLPALYRFVETWEE